MKVLVLRAADDARRTGALLAARGHEVILSPVLDIRRLPFALPDRRIDVLIATSAHAFGEAAPAALADVPLFLVGGRTAEAASGAGFRGIAAVAPTSAALAHEIAARLPQKSALLYLAGRDRKPDLENALAQSHDLTVVETYVAQTAEALAPEAQAALRADDIGAALHFSRRSATIFCNLVARAALRDEAGAIKHIAISADAAAPLQAHNWRVEIAATPDEQAMIEKLEEHS